MKKIVICGAGGFIGGHLTKALKAMGHQVRAVDIKPLTRWYQITPGVENFILDLKKKIPWLGTFHPIEGWTEENL